MADCFKESLPIPPNFRKCSEIVDEHYYFQKLEFKNSHRAFANLFKLKLTSLVTFTAVGGYFLAHGPLDPLGICAAAAGVFLCSCAANIFNHYIEFPFDSQMERTRNRVIPMCILKPEFAALIGLGLAAGGGAVLYQINFFACALGVFNIFLYSFIYTPLKRRSFFNTHVGSAVGAIPPLIGWTCAKNGLDPVSLIIGAILCSWQFVHFNALSWNLRGEYSLAGYKMMAVVNPQRLKNSTLFHSLVILCACLAVPSIGIAQTPFIAGTLWINLLTVYSSYLFYRQPNKKNSKFLFNVSLVQITIIMSAIIGLYAYDQFKDSLWIFISKFNRLE